MNTKLLAFVIFLFTFILYAQGVSHSVYGGDSGDIILASWFGGVAHPPGYPLNSMIGWIFTHLPYSASVAFKANLMAAFSNAITVSLIFLICQRLTKNIIPSIVAALILAFNALFWLYGHIIEVFQLNVVLCALAIYFLFYWGELGVKKRRINLLYLSFLFLGLASFHHHTSVLLFPAFGYFIYRTDKRLIKNSKEILRLSGIVLLGVAPYIFTVWAAFRKTPLNWDDPTTLSNLVRLMTRADYGTFLSSSEFLGLTLSERFGQIFYLFLTLKSDFLVVGLILVSLGFVHVFQRNRNVFWFLVLAVIFTGPFFIFYASFPLSTNFLIGLWERFILLTYFILSIAISYGVKYFLEIVVRLTRFTEKKTLENFIKFSSWVLIILIPLNLFLSNFYKVNLSTFDLGDSLGHDFLISAEEKSIVILSGDTAFFNTQYIYHTNSKFKSIKLIRSGGLKHLDYRESIARQYPELTLPSNFFADEVQNARIVVEELIRKNMDNYPVFVAGILPEVEGVEFIDVGLMRKAIKSPVKPEDVVGLNTKVLDSFKFDPAAYDPDYVHFIMNHVVHEYYLGYVNIADSMYKLGEHGEAQKYAKVAANLMPGEKEAYIRLGVIAQELGECGVANDAFLKIYEIDKGDWQALYSIADVQESCFQNKSAAEEFKNKADELKSSQDDAGLEMF